jgi:hypothetical protein
MEEIDVPENSANPAAEISLTSFDLTTGSTELPIRLSVEIPDSDMDTAVKLRSFSVTEEIPSEPSEPVVDYNDLDDVRDRTFDARIRRTFAIRKMHFTEQKKYVASAGLRTNKSVLVIETVSPLKIKRIISVTGENAKYLHEWFL